MFGVMNSALFISRRERMDFDRENEVDADSFIVSWRF